MTENRPAKTVDVGEGMPGNAHDLAACTVCGGRRLVPLRAYRRAHLVRCRGCGLVFADKRPSDARLAAHYGSYSRADYDSPITRKRYGELLGSFERYRQTNRILDVGCGIGFFLEEAQRRGWEAHGSELEERAVEIVRAKGLNCAQAPIRPDTFEPDSFDVVTAFEVVEHVSDPLAEASAIAAALRPGGLLYLTTPNFGSLSRRLLRGRWSVVGYPEHLTYFTPSTLSSWLARFGFVRVELTTTGISLARLRRGLPAVGSKRGSDEQLREQIEDSRLLQVAKRTAEAVLGATRTGDTTKARFELRP
jgi:2-polyprenyl-3-methyl-5-hydroxy-6-metoxy-1,4-benzoquinol methylase